MGADFTTYSDQEIVNFIDENFEKFAKERSEEFPESLVLGLAAGHLFVVRAREGFAVACRGRHYRPGPGHVPADLLFLYVAPVFEGQGIGGALLDEVERTIEPGVSTVLLCEGSRRKEFFVRHGYTVSHHWPEDDTYKMVRAPARLDAAD